nr:tigger transposable element-derived protein 6-like [Aedes albopictus]
MVRNYIRKTTRRAWAVTQLTGAIRDVRSGQSTNSVCLKYSIPKRTLRRYLEKQGGTKGNVVLPHLGNFVPIFDEVQEERLVGIIIRMSDCGYGLTSKDVRSLAFQFAETNNITHPFAMEKQHAGLGWYIGFRRRHPNLALRTPEKTSMARSTGSNRAAVNVFYDNLERIYGTSVYSPDRIWNADETGFSTVPNKSSKVLAVKGRRQVGAISSAERGVNTTVMMTVSAAGQYLPPMFIFPRQRMNDALKIGAPAGSIFECNPSGWSTVATCTKWFDHFLAYTRPTAEAPVLLILDGHSSHTKNVEMIEKAARNNVRILSIPPHTSHKLQSLDVSVMGPLKTKYGQAVDRLLRREPGRVVTVYDVATLVNEAFEATATMKNAVAEFRATGIYPFDTGLFSDADFAAATNLNAINRTADKNVQTEAIGPTPSTAAEIMTISICEDNSHITTQDMPGHDDLIQVNGCEVLQLEIPNQERNEPEFGWEVSGDSEFLTVDPNVYYTVEKKWCRHHSKVGRSRAPDFGAAIGYHSKFRISP